jgi:hypothetical protein
MISPFSAPGRGVQHLLLLKRLQVDLCCFGRDGLNGLPKLPNTGMWHPTYRKRSVYRITSLSPVILLIAVTLRPHLL